MKWAPPHCGESTARVGHGWTERFTVPRLTPIQRSLRGQIAAETRWGNTSQAERTRAAERGQAGLWARFEREVDPDGALPPAERAKRAANLRRAHMARVALASSRARAARKTGGAL
jgi:hypothetical protein